MWMLTMSFIIEFLKRRLSLHALDTDDVRPVLEQPDDPYGAAVLFLLIIKAMLFFLIFGL
jgi:hypothetical protein